MPAPAFRKLRCGVGDGPLDSPVEPENDGPLPPPSCPRRRASRQLGCGVGDGPLDSPVEPENEGQRDFLVVVVVIVVVIVL